MKSVKTDRIEIPAREVLDKLGIKGELLSFSVPSKNNKTVLTDKLLLIIIKLEGKNEKVLSERRIETNTTKSKKESKDK